MKNNYILLKNICTNVTLDACRSCRAFTLLELLVVVLIIGILAAVAVPQYKKAVVKSELLQLATDVRQFRQAIAMYKLANGTYPTHTKQLDVWDSINLNANNSQAVLHKRTYYMQSTYFRTGDYQFKGLKLSYCDFQLSGIFYCHVSPGKDSELVEKLGWKFKVFNGINNEYYIPGAETKVQ